MREVRIRFSKTDRLKYISHLDINRAMSRAFKRADIPLWYTEGFNPHPYMSFSLPLSLGVESMCESVDIRIIDDIDNLEIKRRMNDALPDGLKVIDVYDNFRDCSEIAFSDYVFKFQFDDNKSALEKIKSVLESEQILALKKAKQRFYFHKPLIIIQKHEPLAFCLLKPRISCLCEIITPLKGNHLICVLQQNIMNLLTSTGIHQNQFTWNLLHNRF